MRGRARPVSGLELAPTTANRMLTALRRVLTECWRLRLLDQEELDRATGLKRLPGRRLARGRLLSLGELQALFQVCAQDPGPASRDVGLSCRWPGPATSWRRAPAHARSGWRGPYDVVAVVAGHEVRLRNPRPVRCPLPVRKRTHTPGPLLTGQRVLDLL